MPPLTFSLSAQRQMNTHEVWKYTDAMVSHGTDVYLYSYTQTLSHIQINRSSCIKNIMREHVCVHMLPHIGPFIQSYCGGERVVFHSLDVSNFDEWLRSYTIFETVFICGELVTEHLEQKQISSSENTHIHLMVSV